MSTAPSTPAVRHLGAIRLLVSAAWLAFAGPVLASDAHDAHAAPAKAAPKPAPAVPEARKGTAPGDPMDALREKLASKLGAAKAPEAPTPYVMRVVAKSGEATPGTAGAHVAKAAAAHGGDSHGGTPAKVAKLRSAKAAAGHQADAHAAHWSYGGDGGPEKWGQLKPEFST
ncbi:MAG: carbonate dehydratase, partial [Burkholderiales bacterium PBB5]